MHSSTPHRRNWVPVIRIIVNILVLILNHVSTKKMMANFEVNSLKMHMYFFPPFYVQFGYGWKPWFDHSLTDYLRLGTPGRILSTIS